MHGGGEPHTRSFVVCFFFRGNCVDAAPVQLAPRVTAVNVPSPSSFMRGAEPSLHAPGKDDRLLLGMPGKR